MSVISFPRTSRAPAKAGYETGMRVSYDADSRQVTVAFRGRISTLPGLYGTHEEGVWAGEVYCQYHGWRRSSPGKAPARRA